jgi:hypothetical protein
MLARIWLNRIISTFYVGVKKIDGVIDTRWQPLFWDRHSGALPIIAVDGKAE